MSFSLKTIILDQSADRIPVPLWKILFTCVKHPSFFVRIPLVFLSWNKLQTGIIGWKNPKLYFCFDNPILVELFPSKCLVFIIRRTFSAIYAKFIIFNRKFKNIRKIVGILTKPYCLPTKNLRCIQYNFIKH